MLRYILLCVILLSVISLKAQEDTIVHVKASPNVSSSAIFADVDQKPEFPGGKEALIKFYKKITTFEICRDGGDCRTVYYQVVIDTLGNAGSFNIIKGINEIYNNETKRIVDQMPKWKPGKKGGVAVKTLITLDIKYLVE